MSTVRPVRVEDADRLGEVHVAAWLGAYRGLLPDAYLDGLEAADRAAHWRRQLTEPTPTNVATLAALDDDAVVGFATVGPERDGDGAVIGELYALNVHPDAWGHGHGAELLAAAVAALRGSGFEHAVLWVVPGNVRARRFYEHHDWVVTTHERTAEVFGVTVPEVAYERSL